MRRVCLLLAVIAASIFLGGPVRAGTIETQIHLIVMGAGEHLYTRGGHAALMVVELDNGEAVKSTVYNYGDTNWDDPMLVPHFLRGDLVFFLSDSGGLVPTLEEYGVRQGRAVTRQRLNLSPDQVAEVARRLREGTAPGKREYVFHHRRALCSTRIMDLLDDVLDGKLRAELASSKAPYTGRHYQEVIFSASPLASIAGDLFLGRLHDQVLDKYEATAAPEHMRDYLRAILVPSPSGTGKLVPLAGPPAALVEVVDPIDAKKSRFTLVLWSALIAALVGFGARAHLRAAKAPVHAARVVFWGALCSGLVGLIILAFIVLSRVPELRQNELILILWPTDLWLAGRMHRISKGVRPDTWVRGYADARVIVAGLVALGHVTGVLYQEPRILAALGCTFAAVTWALVRALGRAAAPKVKRERPSAA
jgi:hypothetical protein